MLVAAVGAAVLLAVAGAAKVLDPTMTVGALRAMGLPSGRLLVRAGAAAELALGLVALVWGGTLPWSLVALSYAAFAVFVVAALRSGRPVGSCGCFGRADTPPAWWHVAANVALSAAALAAALG